MPVDPYKGEIYTLRFGAAGMVAHPNRWLSQPSELVVAQNITFENDYVQKEAAAADYDSTGIAVEAPNGTFSAVTDSTMGGIWLPAASGTVFGLQLASLVANTTSPWSVPVTNTAAAGTLVCVAVGQVTNNTNNPMLTSVTDSQGNTYVRARTTLGSGTVTSEVEMWLSVLTTPITNVDTFTLTFTTVASDARVVTAASYTLVPTTTSEATVASSLDSVAVFSSATNTYTGRSYPALLLAAVHWNKINTTTVTWAGGFTQNAAASSGAIGTQISLASKLAPFSTGIVAQVDWNPEVFTSPAGTVTTVANSNVVIGVGTSFVTFAPGDEIVVVGETHIIDHVTSNTQLETIDAWVGSNAAVAWQEHSGPRIVTATLNGWLVRDRPDQGGNTGNLDRDTLKTGLTISRDYRGRFIQGGKEVAANNRKLFYFNGVDPVQVLSGTAATTTDIAATRPLDWDTVQNPSKQPVNGIVHIGHLIGFGNTNDPHRIYISDPGNHEVFQGATAFQFSIASNIGERLWCAAEFQGVCFFWKYPNGIFYLDDTDPSFLNWSFHTRSEALGCARSPYAVLPIDDDVLFCNADGHFHLLSAVDTLGGQRTSDITRLLGLQGFTRDTINTNALNTLTSAWDPVTKTATFGLRSKNATGTDNDLLFRFDFGLVTRGGPIRFSYSTLWKPNALTIKRRDYNGRQAMLIGETTTSMFIDPFHYGYRTIAGVTTGFAHTLRTPQLDFSDQDPANRLRRKHYDAVELVLSDPAVLTNNPLTVGVYVDNVLRQTQTFRNSSRRPMLQLNCGDGYEFALSLSSASGSTIDIPQLGALIYWRPGGQDKSRAA